MASKINMNDNAGYLPICFYIERKACLVVGGGKVAFRKITILKKFGAVITCLSPIFVKPLERLHATAKIKCVKRGYPQTLSLKKYALVIAATNDPVVNKRVASDAKRDNVLFNVVDKSAAGSVIMPAILKHKGMLISVSTGGRSPSQAKKTRDILKGVI
ncbi:MAG: bifunctional precorrin-2 dehydrogenase/sirohydrochlorin ferrochelatase [Candidatus Omnitrophica bacterium]|nr:bifunctional precorrin-2 dehydrogenase/sirohydrochlorin ferrochelatase [Candidatus Omnitrophota bacterium]